MPINLHCSKQRATTVKLKVDILRDIINTLEAVDFLINSSFFFTNFL